MKVNSVKYTGPSQNNNNLRSPGKNPSFGNLAVGLATFIENNGFLGEFLTIDTCGMMAPRTIQGYTRNMKELGRPNYKAGREELVRELLSGPAYFYVPLSVLTLAGFLRGKSAQVETKVISTFKSLMKNTLTGNAVKLKDAESVRTNFVKTVLSDAFKADYKNQINLVDDLEKKMNEYLTYKYSLKDKISNMFKKKADRKISHSALRAEIEKLVTKLNKANGKLLDNADCIELTVETVNKQGVAEKSRRAFNVNSLMKDVSNYLDDFSSKAKRTKKDQDTFVEKFHRNAKDLRNITNILAVSALSAFLMIIPKIYQTDKTFPGKDGLTTNTNSNAQTPEENKEKEGV